MTIPLGIIVTSEDDFYCLSGGYTGSDQIYGGKGAEFLHLYEDPVYSYRFCTAMPASYLRYLRIIDKQERADRRKTSYCRTRNQELMELLELEKSLVYFTTSLRSNEMVLEKLLEGREVLRNIRKIQNFWKMLLLRTSRRLRWQIFTAEF